MNRFAAKLAFVHRSLWQRDPAYRWAVLLGPPPLLGGAVAVLAWAVLPLLVSSTPAPDTAAPWAHWHRPATEQDQPFAEAPTAALPRIDATGELVGLVPGWQATIHPMSVDAAMDPNLARQVLTKFTLDEPVIPFARIVDAGPPAGLFAVIAETFFVARTPGLYALSVRLARTGTQSANCVVRFASPKHQMVRNVRLNTIGDTASTFTPTEFRLAPGLLELAVAAGCWRGDHMVGGGDITVMVRRPGEVGLTPAAARELMRPVPRALPQPGEP